MSGQPADPSVNLRGEPHVRRWHEQRWVIDNAIRANGLDWDQPRSLYLSAPCGVEASADFAAIRARVQKLADLTPAFESAAKRREAKAKAADDAGAAVTARDNYFMAAVHWGAAQWLFAQNDAINIAFNKNKRACFTRYAELADHKVEAVWIPFKGSVLPAWFHLPPNYNGGRIPAVIIIPGMDNFKEASVALYGDRWLNRGMAVLVIDGPGQYEAIMHGVHVSMDNWTACGPLVFDWLAARPEIDVERIGVTGTSFGSLFGTIVAASEPRIRACAVISTCLEPGCRTIFEEGSPTFKKRFMYMSGYTDEDAFDAFCPTLTWEGLIDRVRMPYLCLAGEAEELSPLHHTERMMTLVPGPKQLVIYQDSRHSVGGVPSTNLGPMPQPLMADWMAARFSGRPFTSERWYVDATGRVNKTPL